MQVPDLFRVVIVALFLGAGLYCPATALGEDNREDEAVVYLNTALRALRGGDAGQALGILNNQASAVEEGASMALHHGLACRAWLVEGQPEKALVHCEQAISLDSSRSRWRYYNNLGIAAFRLGDDAAAREAFQAAAVISGVVVTPRKNLELVEQLATNKVDRNELGHSMVIR